MTRSAVIDMLSDDAGSDLAVEFVQERESGEDAIMNAYADDDWPACDAASDAFWASMEEEEIKAAFVAYAG